MNLSVAITSGFVGTLLLTSVLRAASELRLTRMDFPFLLGTAFSADRSWAKVIGYLLHFATGMATAFIYQAVFVAMGRSDPWLGALLGLGHAVFVGTAAVNILLPAIHPRMGTPFNAADSAPLLEPPGFMMLNYGRNSPAVMILAHMAYGALIGHLCC